MFWINSSHAWHQGYLVSVCFQGYLVSRINAESFSYVAKYLLSSASIRIWSLHVLFHFDTQVCEYKGSWNHCSDTGKGQKFFYCQQRAKSLNLMKMEIRKRKLYCIPNVRHKPALPSSLSERLPLPIKIKSPSGSLRCSKRMLLTEEDLKPSWPFLATL